MNTNTTVSDTFSFIFFLVVLAMYLVVFVYSYTKAKKGWDINKKKDDKIKSMVRSFLNTEDKNKEIHLYNSFEAKADAYSYYKLYIKDDFWFKESEYKWFLIEENNDQIRFTALDDESFHF